MGILGSGKDGRSGRSRIGMVILTYRIGPWLDRPILNVTLKLGHYLDETPSHSRPTQPTTRNSTSVHPVSSSR